MNSARVVMFAGLSLTSCFIEPASTTSGASPGETGGDESGPGDTTTSSDGGDVQSTTGAADSSDTSAAVADSTDTTSGGTETGDSTGPTPSECSAAGTTVFVNFDGVTLSAGPRADAPLDVTDLPGADTRWSPYGGNDRDTVLATVVDAFAPFDVCITQTRPSRGEYSMVVITADEDTGAALAFGPQDCGNLDGDRDVALVFAPLAIYSPAAKGFVIASVIAGMFGLGPVTGAPDDIMRIGIDTNDSGLSFTDTCYPLDPIAGCLPTSCEGQSQSSVALLTAVLGLAD
ncbi:MAG: hypothetical protein AAF721_26755 [Myxococcota bacterium]